MMAGWVDNTAEVTVTAPRLGAKCAPPRESRAVYVLPHAREVGGGV